MSLSPDIVNDYIRSRRSTFVDQFEPGKIIPDEIITELLTNANCAPTHKLTEPWRFIIFSGEGLETLAERQSGIYKEFSGAKFKQNKYDKLLITPQQCSHVIAICMKRTDDIPEIEEVASVACAVQNLYLSLAPYGIGGYWSTGGIVYMDAAKDWLGLSSEDKLMGFFFLGYVKVPTPHRTPGELEKKIRWVRGREM